MRNSGSLQGRVGTGAVRGGPLGAPEPNGASLSRRFRSHPQLPAALVARWLRVCFGLFPSVQRGVQGGEDSARGVQFDSDVRHQVHGGGEACLDRREESREEDGRRRDRGRCALKQADREREAGCMRCDVCKRTVATVGRSLAVLILDVCNSFPPFVSPS